MSGKFIPPDIFIRRKKYDTPVYQSRHPGLNEYISGAVKAVGEELVQVSQMETQDHSACHELGIQGQCRQSDSRHQKQGGSGSRTLHIFCPEHD